jgi:hypothetical protein
VVGVAGLEIGDDSLDPVGRKRGDCLPGVRRRADLESLDDEEVTRQLRDFPVTSVEVV